MISLSVRLSGGSIRGLGFDSLSLFDKNRMERLGEFAIQTVKARVARGIGSDDAQMAPLSGSRIVKAKVWNKRSRYVTINGRYRMTEGYAAWKSKHGLQPIRDLKGTGKDGGNMLENLTVRSVSESLVTIGFSQNKARAKAISNERKSPWLSFSDSDERLIVAYARQMFQSQVEVIRRQMFTGSARTGSYVDAPLSLPELSLPSLSSAA